MSVTLQVGQSQQMSAAFADQFGAALHGIGVPIWSSSNPSVASVNAVGLATALAGGSATITASLDGVTGSSVVTVPTIITLVSDTFTRTNGVSPGTADTGQTWLALTGAWSTNGTQLVAPNASAPIVVVESGSSDVTIEVDGIQSNGAGQQDICFRLSDVNNCFIAGFHNATDIYVFRQQAGSFTPIAGPFTQSGMVGRLKVVSIGSSIAIYFGGALITSLTDSFNQTATKHGCYGTVGIFDNFVVTSGP